MNPKQGTPPLVVIAVVNKDNKAAMISKLKNVGQKWRESNGAEADRNVVFAYMDAVKWGKWLKGMYGITGAEEATLPPIVVADHTVSSARLGVYIVFNPFFSEIVILGCRRDRVADPGIQPHNNIGEYHLRIYCI
jgi:hypothetical protein